MEPPLRRSFEGSTAPVPAQVAGEILVAWRATVRAKEASGLAESGPRSLEVWRGGKH